MPDTPPPPAESDAPLLPEPGPAPAAAKPEEDWESRFKYLLADFENFRRRSARERDQARQAGEGRILRALIPLGEALERAELAARRLPEKDALRSGITILRREWESLQQSAHVEAVARVGERFEPETQEAVGETPGGPDQREDTVSEIVQQGYRSDSGLLRPAKVIVARASRSIEPPVPKVPAPVRPSGTDAPDSAGPTKRGSVAGSEEPEPGG